MKEYKSIKELMSALDQSALDAVTGKYMDIRNEHGDKAIELLTKNIQVDGANTIQNKLKEIELTLKEASLTPAYSYDEKNHTIQVIAYRGADVKKTDPLQINVSLANNTTFGGNGKQSTANSYQLGGFGRGDKGIHTIQEGQVIKINNLLKKNIDKMINPNTSLANFSHWVNKASQYTTSGVSKAIRKEGEKDRRVTNPLEATMKSMTIGFEDFLESFMYEKGSDLGKLQLKGLPIDKMVGELIGAVLAGKTEKERMKALSSMEKNAYFKPLTTSNVWNGPVKNKMRDAIVYLAKTNLTLSQNYVNEEAMSHAALGASNKIALTTGDMFEIDPGKRQQGTHVADASKKAKQDAGFIPSRFISEYGQAQGAQYGREGDWDSEIRTILVTQQDMGQAYATYRERLQGKITGLNNRIDKLKEIENKSSKDREEIKKLNKQKEKLQKEFTRITPTIEEGQLFVTKEIMSALGTSEISTGFSLGADEQKEFFDKVIFDTHKKGWGDKHKNDQNVLNYKNAETDEQKATAQQTLFNHLIKDKDFITQVFRQILKSKHRYYKDAEAIDTGFDENGLLRINGSEKIGARSADRAVSTSTKGRHAIETINKEVIEILAEQLGIPEEVRSSIKGVSELKSVTQRSYGGLASGILDDFINITNKDSSLKDIQAQLAAQGDYGALFANQLEANKDGQILIKNLAEIPEQFAGNAEEYYLGVIEAIIKANNAKLGVELNPSRAMLAGTSLNMTNITKFGEMSNKGAVSLYSSLPSLDNAIYNTNASYIDPENSNNRRRFSKEDIEDFKQHTHSLLGFDIDPKDNPAYRELIAQERAAENMTKASSKEGFNFDKSKYISIGKGEGYDIDLTSTELEDPQYSADGKIANFDKTLTGKIQELKLKRLQNKEEYLGAYLDNINMLETNMYDDTVYTVAGKKMFLPEYYGDSYGKGEARYGGAYFDTVGRLARSVASDVDDEQKSKQALELMGEMRNDVEFKEGGIYESFFGKKAPNSMYGKLTAMSVDDVLDDTALDIAKKNEDYLSIFRSNMATAGVGVNRKAGQKTIKGWDDDTALNYYKEYYNKDFKKKGSKKKWRGELNKALEDVLTMGTDANIEYIKRNKGDVSGIRGAVNRLPNINGRDLKLIDSIFIDPSLQGDQSMRMGYGLATMINADYDGDRIATVLEKNLTDAQKDIYKEQNIQVRDVARDLVLKHREKWKNEDKDWKESFAFSDAAKLYSGIIARGNKTSTGLLSNISTAARQTLALNGQDETALAEDAEDKNNQMTAAKGMIVRSFFEGIEQDVISSKKVIERLIKKKIQNTQGVDEKEAAARMSQMSEKDIQDNYIKAFTDVEDVVNQFTQGNVTLTDLIPQLQDMGVLGADNEFLSGRVTEQNLAIIRRFTHGKEILSELFGIDDDKALKEALDSGAITKDVFLKSLYSSTGGNPNNFINKLRTKTDEINHNKIDNTTQSAAYRLSDKQGVNVDNIKQLNLTADAYERLEKQIGENSKALKKEIELEKIKTGVATKEGKAVGNDAAQWEKLGDSIGAVADKKDYVTHRAAVLGRNTHYGATSSEENKVNTVFNKKLKEQKSIIFEEAKKRGYDLTYVRNLGELQELMPQGEYQKLVAQVAPNADMSNWDNTHIDAKTRIKDKNYFGYTSIKKFKEDRDSALASFTGTYSHKIAEVLNKAKLQGHNFDSFDALKRGLSKEQLQQLFTETGYDAALQEYTAVLNMAGFTEDEKRKKILNTQSRGEANRRTAEKYAEAHEGEIIGSELKIRAKDNNDTQLSGAIDALYKTKNEWLGGYDLDIIDYKNQEGGPTLTNLIQQIIYKEELKRIREQFKDVKDKDMESEVANYNKYNPNHQLTTELAKTIRDSKNIAAKLVSTNAKGKTEVVTLDDIPLDIISKIMSFEELTEEDKKQIWSASHITSDDKTLKAGTRKKVTKTSSSADREDEYLRLYGEIQTKRGQVEELNIQQGITGISAKLQQRVKNLEQEITQLEHQQDELTTGKHKFGKRAQARVDAGKQEIDEAYDNNVEKMHAANIDRAHTAMESYISQYLKGETQIYELQNKINLALDHREKESYQKIIGLTREQIQGIREKAEQLAHTNILSQEELRFLQKQYETEKQISRAKADMKNHGSRNIWDIMRRDIKRATMRITDYGVASRILYTIPRDIRKVIEITKQLDVALMNLRVVTGYNRKEAEGLMVTYQRLGKQLGATTQEVAASANEWLRQGYNASEAGRLIEASTKLSKLGMINASDATKFLTSALKGFKMEVEGAISIVDKLTKVDMAAAVSAGDIAQGLSRMATSAQLAGLNMDQAIGILSTIGEVTQKDIGSIGDSIKTLLSRYGNVKAGVFTQMGLDDGGETTDNINDIEKVLGKLGIKIRSSNMEMRNISDVLDELAGKWGTLDTVSKNAVATAFAGVRQRENFNVLMENYDRVKELEQASANSLGTANAKYKAYEESIEFLIKKLQNAWEEFSMSLESSWVIKTGLKATIALTESLNSLIKAVGLLGGMGLAMKAPELLSKAPGFFSAKGKGAFLLGRDNNIGLKGGYKTKVLTTMEQGFTRVEQAINQNTQVTQQVSGTPGSVNSINMGAINKLGKKATHDEMLRAGLGNNYDAYKQAKSKIDKDYVTSYAEDPLIASQIYANDSAELDKKYGVDVINKQEQAREQARKMAHRRHAAGIAMGVMAGVTSGLSTDTVGNNSLASKFWNPEGHTVEATTTDKVTTGIVTGGLTAIGGALGGPLGAMIGGSLGGMISDGVTFALHKSEIEQQKRIEKAQKKLENLANMDSVIDNIDNITSKEEWDSSDYEQAQSYVDQFTSLLSKDADLRLTLEERLKSLGEEFDTLDEGLGALVAGGNIEKTKEVLDQIRLAVLDEQEKNLITTNELNETKTQQLMSAESTSKDTGNSLELAWQNSDGSSRGYDLKGDTLEEQRKSLIDQYKTDVVNGTVTKEQSEAVEARLAELDEQIEANKKGEAAIRKVQAEKGIISSKVTDLGNYELQKLGYQGVIDLIANNTEGARNEDGTIKAEYLTEIEKLIKANDKLVQVTRPSILTFNDMTKMVQDAENAVDNLNVKLQAAGKETVTITKLQNLFNHETDENRGLLTSYAEMLGLTIDELRGLVYGSDTAVHSMEDFANAMHMTVERAKELKDQLGDFSLNDALLSPSGVRDKYNGLFDLYKDFAGDLQFSAENVEKIIKQYPELYAYIDNPTAMLKALSDKIFGGSGNFLYGNATFGELLNSEELLNQFKEDTKLWGSIIEDDTLTADIRSKLKNTKNFNDLSDIIFGLDKTDLSNEQKQKLTDLGDKVQEYLGKSFSMEADSTLLEKVGEYQNKLIDKRIKNLEEEKKLLDEVVSTREYELKLLRAQDELENAKKDKKRVYRTGIGWAYEADTTKVQKAKDNLESLNRDRQKKQLDLQIEDLKYQKEILTAIKQNKEDKSLKALYDLWAGGITGVNIKVQDSLSTTSERIFSQLDILYNGVNNTVAGAAGVIQGTNTTLTEAQDILNNVNTTLQDQDMFINEILKTTLQGVVEQDEAQITQLGFVHTALITFEELLKATTSEERQEALIKLQDELGNLASTKGGLELFKSAITTLATNIDTTGETGEKVVGALSNLATSLDVNATDGPAKAFSDAIDALGVEFNPNQEGVAKDLVTDLAGWTSETGVLTQLKTRIDESGENILDGATDFIQDFFHTNDQGMQLILSQFKKYFGDGEDSLPTIFEQAGKDIQVKIDSMKFTVPSIDTEKLQTVVDDLGKDGTEFNKAIKNVNTGLVDLKEHLENFIDYKENQTKPDTQEDQTVVDPNAELKAKKEALYNLNAADSYSNINELKGARSYKIDGTDYVLWYNGNMENVLNYIDAIPTDHEYSLEELRLFADGAFNQYNLGLTSGASKALKKLIWKRMKDRGLASGTFSAEGGQTLINELGTEAIITPQGTLTALPSKSGIIPADITKNLWQLGEIAPNLIAPLRSLSNVNYKTSSQEVVNNDGTNIDTLNMTVYPTKDYDMDKLLEEAKTKARVSNHNY